MYVLTEEYACLPCLAVTSPLLLSIPIAQIVDRDRTKQGMKEISNVHLHLIMRIDG